MGRDGVCIFYVEIFLHVNFLSDSYSFLPVFRCFLWLASLCYFNGDFISNPLLYSATKIVLSGNSASQLMEMENEAKRLDLSFYLVVDAGRTQVS